MTQPRDILARFMKAHPAKRLGVAVSGGGDSLALLHLLSEIRPPESLFVATVDHGLRRESRAEAEFVAQVCAKLGVEHQILVWSDKTAGGNLMDQARRARRTLLANWAEHLGLDAIALGHTLDDIAETFLMRLGRAAGVDGLAAMADHFHAGGANWVRPLLSVSRADLRSYCQTNDLNWIDDPTNDNMRYDRTKARRAIADLGQNGIEVAQIAASAKHLARARQTLAELLVRETRSHTSWQDGVLCVKAEIFSDLPIDMQRIWLRAALTWHNNAGYGPRANAVAKALSDVTAGQKTTLGGCVIWTQDTWVNVAREPQAVLNQTAAPDGVWDNDWVLEGPKVAKTHEIKALGENGLQRCKAWRETGRLRTALLSSPSLWLGDQLICAPLAEIAPEWRAKNLKNLSDFFTSILSR